MFVERQRLGAEAFEIGAEHVEELIGRRAAAFLLAFENHNLTGAHRVSDLFAERRAEVRPDQQHHVETAWEQRHCVAVVIEAAHQCMTCRGVHKTGVSMVTSKMIGAFREDDRTRREFLSMISNPSSTAELV